MSGNPPEPQESLILRLKETLSSKLARTTSENDIILLWTYMYTFEDAI